MISSLLETAKNNKGAMITGGIVTTVVTGMFSFLTVQFNGFMAEAKAAREDAVEARTQLFTLFQDMKVENQQSNTRQWQNIAIVAKAVQDLSVQLARIDGILRLPIADRPPPSTAEPPKAVELKPPTNGKGS